VADKIRAGQAHGHPGPGGVEGELVREVGAEGIAALTGGDDVKGVGPGTIDEYCLFKYCQASGLTARVHAVLGRFLPEKLFS